jgi:hypothetical protein
VILLDLSDEYVEAVIRHVQSRMIVPRMLELRHTDDVIRIPGMPEPHEPEVGTQIIVRKYSRPMTDEEIITAIEVRKEQARLARMMDEIIHEDRLTFRSGVTLHEWMKVQHLFVSVSA